MTPEEFKKILQDNDWLRNNQFEILAELSRQIFFDVETGRDLLIRLLEKRDIFEHYEPILSDLIEKTGLYPYLEEYSFVSDAEQIAYEFHRPIGLNDIVLHSEQLNVYHRLLSGENIILSAPTSFGKSLLIDAMIASEKFNDIVIIVPTIALIDETRRRLSGTFSNGYKVITHASQVASKRNIYVLTQERFLEFDTEFNPDFFVIDEFYKLDSGNYDERTVSLNSALFRLCRDSKQFLLIGPNIQNVNSGNFPIEYSFIRTDFKTVATDIIYVESTGKPLEDCISTCRQLVEPTLIFCKSSNSAYTLAAKMVEEGFSSSAGKAKTLAKWLRDNYHPDWDLAKFVEHGIAVHHGSLPRSISHYLLKLFNDRALNFLLCTSTIIEGVNTSAKNIVIFDNKIAKSKFDFFTFNNIKGRAGRMLKHFVGHVYLLNNPPEEELPFVDIPAWSLPDDIPLSLSLELPQSNMTDKTLEQLRYLHAQDYLDVDIIRKHVSIPAENQIEAAKVIHDNVAEYEGLLNWRQFPTGPQLQTICNLIFDTLMAGKSNKDDIFSAKQLNYKIRDLQNIMPRGITELIQKEIQNINYCKSPTEAVEKTLKFLRRWGEYNFPKYLSAVNDIQKYVLEKAGLSSGDYCSFTEQVKQWFLPPAATLLEEYGIPFQIALKIERSVPLGNSPDEIIKNIKSLDISKLNLLPIEKSIAHEAINYL